MYDRYVEYVDMLQANGVALFNNFAYVVAPSKYGSWCVLEYMDQPIDEAPKYRALADWAGYVEPEITVLGHGVSIADEDATPSPADDTDFGTVVQGGAPLSHTFTVRNDGGSPLILWPVAVPSGFTVTENLPASLAAGASATFTVRLDTALPGAKAGEIYLANGDTDESLFDFRIAGAVLTGPATISQWASTVLGCSSEYAASPAPWSSSRALGAPDVTVYRDDPNAWAPSVANGTTEWIALGYTTPVYATAVRVRESFGNGAVTKIELREQGTGTWHAVWSGVDATAPGAVSDLEVALSPTSYLADGVRITLDMNHSPAWEEIDAVGLYGSLPATVGDRVWLDTDGDGIQDPGEPGVAGVTVRLLDGHGNPTGLSTTTDSGGHYSFTVAAGTYRLEFVAPSGMAWTRVDSGSEETLDSDVEPATGRTGVFTVVAGQTDTNWDAGLVAQGMSFQWASTVLGCSSEYAAPPAPCCPYGP